MSLPLIPRPQYTARIAPFIDRNIIKVVTGQRRVGKSFVLRQLMDEVRGRDPEANIISINKERSEFRDIRTDEDLALYLKPRLEQAGRAYLFIDEVQEIKDFQLCLRSLLVEDECDIFCTGSNANLLSGELATTLAGRCMSFDVHALSYREFLQFHKLERGADALRLYLTYGGMPYLAHTGLAPENDPFEYLRNVYQAILLKDTVARENIRNVKFLEELVNYLADNVGNLFSATRISKFLKSQRVELNVMSTLNYLRALANAFLIHRVPQADVCGVKLFEVGEKIYFEDMGISHAIHYFDFQRDAHKVLENAIYLHLIQQRFDVSIGRLGEREIDFVAQRPDKRLYVQACLTAMAPNTREREFGNLRSIPDNCPKYVVTLHDFITTPEEGGIRHLNLEDFLLAEF